MFSLFEAEWDVVWKRCLHFSFSSLSIENHQIKVDVTSMHEHREMPLVPTLLDSDKKSLVRFRESWRPQCKVIQTRHWFTYVVWDIRLGNGHREHWN